MMMYERELDSYYGLLLVRMYEAVTPEDKSQSWYNTNITARNCPVSFSKSFSLNTIEEIIEEDSLIS